MSKHIAFLRAINVGGHNIKMDALKQIFESLGLEKVETFIASGNIFFDTKAGNVKTLEKKIEKKLHKELGFEVAVYIRTDEELARIAKYKPFPQAAATLNIGFLAEPLDEALVRKLAALKTDIDDFHFHGREIYWLCQKKQSESKISNNVIEKTLGIKTTLRGVNTINKMAEKYA